MLRFSLLGSGSSGNAALFVSHHAKILVDNGLSFKELQRRVHTVGETLDGLDAVFVTHEHSDHVGGVGVLARKTGVPVYLTPQTALALSPNVGNIPNIRHFESGEMIQVKDLYLTSFGIPHDAIDPVSFTIASDGAKVGLATDLGHVSNLVRQRLLHSHALVIESNYCPDRLMDGNYPVQIQQRIRGRHGHLSNQDMASLLHDLLHDDLRTVLLVHISENNNQPDIARRMAQGVLKNHPATLHVAEQDEPTPLFEIHP